MSELIKPRKDAWMRRNPLHPGKMLEEGCIGPDAADRGGALTVSDAAAKLGVDTEDLSRVVSGQRGIWPELALRLEAVGWGRALGWLELQARYDLAQVRRHLAESEAALPPVSSPQTASVDSAIP